MTRAGARVVVEAARKAHENDPATLAPVAEFFGVDIDARLQKDELVEELAYSAY
jgi:hypothetical protein